MDELSQLQLERQDFVDNAIYGLLTELNPSATALPWNIEMIADIRERSRYWLVEQFQLSSEMSFYPYIEE